jgi:hypothetical protein
MSGVADDDGDVGQGGMLDVLPAGTSLRGYELLSILNDGAPVLLGKLRGLQDGATLKIGEISLVLGSE